MEPKSELVNLEIDFRDLAFVVAQLKQNEAHYEAMATGLNIRGKKDEAIRINGVSIKCGRIARYISDKMGKREGQ